MNDTPSDPPEEPGRARRPGTAPDGGPYNPPPSAGMAAAFGETRRLREEVAQLRAAVSDDAGRGELRALIQDLTARHVELASTVSEGLAPELGALRQFATEELGRQRQQLDEVLQTLGRERNPPVDWPRLTAAEARDQWAVLARWIAEVLVPWYEITREELPDCWALHRPAVIELSWLRSAHVQAYAPTSPPHVAGEWHQRWRPGAIARLAQVIDRRLCRPGEHLVPQGESRGGPPAPPRPGERLIPPSQQLAEGRHWQENYFAAVQADLQWRTQREAEAAAADSGVRQGGVRPDPGEGRGVDV
ncbi:hypothetical protein [Pseudonocardia sp. D17]|uniref:hypothetical protein n=1 Tax=Pseudonocardia sp. D17 TaxID=882661 RepID=UPI002B3C7B51|nr:hypothetical protein PSD17_15120 [Pseudonocardia sp. D17]